MLGIGCYYKSISRSAQNSLPKPSLGIKEKKRDLQQYPKRVTVYLRCPIHAATEAKFSPVARAPNTRCPSIFSSARVISLLRAIFFCSPSAALLSQQVDVPSVSLTLTSHLFPSPRSIPGNGRFGSMAICYRPQLHAFSCASITRSWSVWHQGPMRCRSRSQSDQKEERWQCTCE